jgi:hypothetical protein
MNKYLVRLECPHCKKYFSTTAHDEFNIIECPAEECFGVFVINVDCYTMIDTFTLNRVPPKKERHEG